MDPYPSLRNLSAVAHVRVPLPHCLTTSRSPLRAYTEATLWKETFRCHRNFDTRPSCFVDMGVMCLGGGRGNIFSRIALPNVSNEGDRSRRLSLWRLTPPHSGSLIAFSGEGTLVVFCDRSWKAPDKGSVGNSSYHQDHSRCVEMDTCFFVSARHACSRCALLRETRSAVGCCWKPSTPAASLQRCRVMRQWASRGLSFPKLILFISFVFVRAGDRGQRAIPVLGVPIPHSRPILPDPAVDGQQQTNSNKHKYTGLHVWHSRKAIFVNDMNPPPPPHLQDRTRNKKHNR